MCNIVKKIENKTKELVEALIRRIVVYDEEHVEIEFRPFFMYNLSTRKKSSSYGFQS